MALKIKSYFNKDTPRCGDLNKFVLKQLPMVQYATVPSKRGCKTRPKNRSPLAGLTDGGMKIWGRRQIHTQILSCDWNVGSVVEGLDTRLRRNTTGNQFLLKCLRLSD